MTFRGWPESALDFYRGLEADNSKAYWQANKATYETAIRAPFEALMVELEPEFGVFRLFRPYRDVRFSKDKAPYKTAAAMSGEGEVGTGFYLQLSANGLFVGSGYYHMAKDQLARFREAVDDERTGTEIERICAGLTKGGYEIGAMEQLKIAPKGYPKDHPRLALLRYKGLVAGRTFPVAGWLRTAKAFDRIVGSWRDQAPLTSWLDAAVGPSELPPDDAPR